MATLNPLFSNYPPVFPFVCRAVFLRFSLFFSLVLTSVSSRAVNYYWVGGSGNWSDYQTHWATSDGGTTFHPNAPTAFDNVFFTAASGLSAGSSVQLDVIGFSDDFDCTDLTANTLFSGAGLYVYGSLKLTGSIQIPVGITFLATDAGQTIDLAGHNLTTAEFLGIGGVWTFQGPFTADYLNHGYGTIHTNNYPITVGNFQRYNPVAFNPFTEIFLGTSILTLTNSNVQVVLFYDNGKCHSQQADLIFQHGGTLAANDDVTFQDVSFLDLNYSGHLNEGHVTGKLLFEGYGVIDWFGPHIIGEAEFQKGGFFRGSSTIGNLTLTPTNHYTFESGSTLTITPTGSLTGANGGGSCLDRMHFYATQTGQAANIHKDGATLNFSWLDIRDVSATGTAIFNAPNSILTGQATGWSNTQGPRELTWVGGPGDWSDPAHWEDEFGNGNQCAPTADDHVFFNAASGLSGGGLVNVDETAFCKNLDCTGLTGNPVFSGNYSLSVYGSMELVADMQFDMNVNFNATTAGQTIDLAGNTLQTADFLGIGGVWTFQGPFLAGYLNHGYGTIHTANYPITVGNFQRYNPVAFNPYTEIFLGTSALTLTNPGAYIVLFYANGKCHSQTADLIFQHGGTIAANNEITFQDISFLDPNQSGHLNEGHATGKLLFEGYGVIDWFGSHIIGEAEFQKNGLFRGSATFQTLRLVAGETYIFQEGSIQTINPTGTILGLNSGGGCSNRTKLYSSSSGAAAFLKKDGAALNFDWLDVHDISVQGTAQFVATNSTISGASTGWTFTINPRNLTWIGGPGNWSDPAHWQDEFGNGNQCPPTSYDNVFFNAASGLSGGGLVNVNEAAFCKNLDCTGLTGNPMFSGSSLSVYGSMELVAAMQLSMNVEFLANTAGQTIDLAGNTLQSVDFLGIGGVWTFQGPFTAAYLNHGYGTIHTANYPITVGNFQRYNPVAFNGFTEIFLGTSTLTLTNPGAYIVLFYANGKCHSQTADLIFQHGGTIAANDDVTFEDISFLDPNQSGYLNEGHATGKLLFEGYGVIDWFGPHIIGEAEFQKGGNFRGSATFQTLRLEPGETYTFEQGSTQTINPTGTLIASGSEGNLTTFQSAFPGSQATIFKNGDLICLDFMYLKDMKKLGTAGLYVGLNSINQANNTGFNFLVCPCLSMTANAGSDGSLCNGSGVGLSANTPAFGAGAWSVVSGPSLALSQFSNAASPTAMFTPGGGAGSYVLRWTVSSGGCPSVSDEVVVTCLASPTVTLANFSPVCISVAAFSLTGGMPTGGIYSGPGVSGGQFNPAAAGAGTHLIQYAFTAANGCSNSATATITVYPLTVGGSVSPGQTICSGAAPFNLVLQNHVGSVVKWQSSPTGSVWTDIASTANPFQPGPMTATTHFRAVVQSGNCLVLNSSSVLITVNAAPTVTLAPFSPVCHNSPAFPLTGNSPAGGTWSGVGVSGSNYNPVFTGTHVITYTASVGSCTNSSSQPITVNAAPTVALANFADACLNAPPFTLTGGSPTGGTYSGPGVASNIFTADDAGPGNKVITYTVTNANGCTGSATNSIHVRPIPPANWGPLSPVCPTAPPFLLTGGTPPGGTYSGTGVTGGNTFHATVAGAGTHLITYTTTNNFGCTGTVTQNQTVSGSCSTTCTIVTCPLPRNVSMTTACKIMIPDLVPEVVLGGNCASPASITQNPAAGTLVAATHNSPQNVVITVIDGAGNTGSPGCTVVLMPKDESGPVISNCSATPSPVGMNSACKISIPNVASMTMATDCTTGALSKTQLPAANTQYTATHNQTFTVVVTVTDPLGNSTTCTRTVVAKDQAKPVITTCAPAQTVPLAVGCVLVFPDKTGQVVATDACSGPPVVSQSPAAGSTVVTTPGATHTMTLTATDLAGNFKTCTAVITAGPTCPPMLLGHDDRETEAIKAPVFIEKTMENNPELAEKQADLQTLPNPFSNELTIAFDLPESGNTKLVLLDLTGQFQFLSTESWLEKGRQKVVWNTEDLPPGAYFVGLKTAERAWLWQKLALVR